jgi:hypothetical protein
MDPALEITIYDKAFRFLGTAGSLRGATITATLHAHDTGDLTLRWDDPLNEDLLAAGCRYVATYRGLLHSSGRVLPPTFDVGPDAPLTYQLVGDYSIFEDTLAWVAPLNPVAPPALGQLGQAHRIAPGDDRTTAGQVGRYLWPPDVKASETALKRIVRDNLLQRLGRPITILPDRQRGGDARAAGRLPDDIRNSSVAEACQPLLDWSGLVLAAWQNETDPTIYVDLVEPAEYGQELDVETGTLANGTIEVGYPAATRVLVMGPGEEADRAFDVVVDTALEAKYGYAIEVTRDATQGDLKWPDGVPDEEKIPAQFLNRGDIAADAKATFRRYLQEQGAKKLAEEAPAAGLTVDIADSDAFHYGGDDGYQIGDTVIVTSHGIEFPERITTATITVAENGQTIVTPGLGDKPAAQQDAEANRIWRALAGLATTARARAANT